VIDIIRYLVVTAVTKEHTCLAGIATVSWCPHWHSYCRLETTKENVAATSRRWLRDICWSRSDHKSRSLRPL